MFFPKVGFLFMILDFWYFAIGHNGNSSCREGWHYAFCQSSQTVKSIYILIKAILGPILLINSLVWCIYTEELVFQFGRIGSMIKQTFRRPAVVYQQKINTEQFNFTSTGGRMTKKDQSIPLTARNIQWRYSLRVIQNSCTDWGSRKWHHRKEAIT